MLFFSIPAAFLLDTLLGDPHTLPHPVRWVGRLAAVMERFWSGRYGRNRRSGFAAGVSVLLTGGLPCLLLLYLARAIHPAVYVLTSAVILYYSFAIRDLASHALRVKKALQNGDIHKARRRLSFMVSRETGQMNESEIIRSTLESLSENFSDSVAAPLFFGMIFGPTGAWLYRILNTLDAMWGYKNDLYLDFGFTAARADDAVNFIPARMSALLLSAAAVPYPDLSGRNALKTVRIDAKKHASPNSGYPEAAAAGALAAGFGGKVVYNGKPRNNPEIGKGAVHISQISKLIRLNYTAAILMMALFLSIYYLTHAIT